MSAKETYETIGGIEIDSICQEGEFTAYKKRYCPNRCPRYMVFHKGVLLKEFNQKKAAIEFTRELGEPEFEHPERGENKYYPKKKNLFAVGRNGCFQIHLIKTEVYNSDKYPSGIFIQSKRHGRTSPIVIKGPKEDLIKLAQFILKGLQDEPIL